MPEPSGPTEPPKVAPTEDDIRSQLAAILASAPFTNANRSSRFLEFCVQQALAGAQDSIKESVLGAEVFDRRVDFDPRTDPIVRVEAGKLRARLKDYYTGEGLESPVIIEMPKGTYVPRFALRPPVADARPAVAPAPKPRWILIASTVALAAVVILALAGLLRIGSPSEPEVPAVAVLPFLNLSSDPRNEYFSDGLADQLTDALAQVDGLHVASRTSAFSFKGKPVDAVAIGAKLRVNAILEGSVQKSGDRLRITVQIIRTRDGYHLWSKTFDREFKAIFDVQDEISRSVVHALQVSLADDSSRKLFRRYTSDPEAFDLYLRGRHALDGLQPDSATQAIALFQRAIDRDPRFALAYAGLATGAAQGIFSESVPPDELRRQVKAAAGKALEIDPTLAEAQAILATVEARFDWNWSGAEQRFRRAIALSPRSPAAHVGLALSVLLPLRRFDAALAECRIALDLDPLSAQTAFCTPWVHIFQGKADLAMAELRKLQEDQPASPAFGGGIAIAAVHAGHVAEVISLSEKMEPDPARRLGQSPAQLGFLAYAYGRAGRTSDAAGIERHFKDLSRTGYVPPGALCLLYLGLDRLPEARAAAVQQIHEHGANVLYLAVDPLFAPLRTDPQFAAVLKSTGLPF
ncbi:tetratricopeptide repeat protein [Paludibaculum fermentans]|uniref:TolB-like protein n=1 Tax=Paludibaculum fermentans TaxID=1473598 RepID=A0A7S7NWX2_PALFE|nr:hypothetical protein [Paludibaculum fermentans]QOY91272.1 hypothetical protein IRI77_15385 [Paludibaculum fermentans]